MTEPRILELLPQLEPGPAFIHEVLARPDRTQLVPVEGFEYDRPRAIAAAYGHMDKLIRDGDVPIVGNRDDHLFRFLARMHGVGVGQERAHALYGEFLDISGGAAPEGWPGNPGDPKDKPWDKIRRIWARVTADNPAGSELMPLTIEEKIAAMDGDTPDPDRLPTDRLWYIDDLINQTPITYWDAERLLPRVAGGAIGIMFGRYSHHKTNLMLSKIRELLVTTDVKVLYLIGEGSGGMGNRIRAQLDFADRSIVEVRERFRIFEIPEITIPEQVGHVEKLCAEAKFKPDIIILDTLANAITGLEEDNRTASLFGRKGPVGGLSKLYKCLVLMIGHEGDVPGKLRGGSGFYGNVDFVIYVRANAHNDACALTAQTSALDSTKPGGGKPFKEAAPIKVYYALEFHQGVPIPVPTSLRGYTLLTAEVDWDAFKGTIGGALTKLGRPMTADVLMMTINERENMDPEDWQARCATLAKKLDRAAREGNPALQHLFEEVDGALVWRTPPGLSAAVA